MAEFNGKIRPVAGRFLAVVVATASRSSSTVFARTDDCTRKREDVPRNRRWPTAFRNLSNGMSDGMFDGMFDGVSDGVSDGIPDGMSEPPSPGMSNAAKA